MFSKISEDIRDSRFDLVVISCMTAGGEFTAGDTEINVIGTLASATPVVHFYC
jgi:hypothetical protein